MDELLKGELPREALPMDELLEEKLPLDELLLEALLAEELLSSLAKENNTSSSFESSSS